MNRAQIALLLLAPLWTPDLALARAQGTEIPAPVRLEETASMDQEVVSLIAARVKAVEEAIAAVQAADEAGRAEAVKAAGEAHADLGIAYEANTMWTPAQACYAIAAKLLPDSPAWGYRLGVCQVSLGDAQKALETFREVAPKLSGTAIVQARLGDTALLLGHLDEAKAAWQTAIDSEAKMAQPVKFAQSRVGLAQVLYELDELEPAEALLREALTINPGYRHAHYVLGLVLAEMDKADESEFQLTLGLNSWAGFPPDPHGPRLANSMAGYGRRMMTVENMLQGGQVPQALQALGQLGIERPEDHFVLNLTARALTMQGQLDQAYQVLATSEAKNPTAQDTKVEMAINLVNRAAQTQDPILRGTMMEDASKKIVEAINLAPLRGRPWYFRGVIEMQRIGQPDQNDPEAMQAAQTAMQSVTQYLQRAHQLGCTEPQLYEQLAQTYAQMGRKPEMLKFAKEGAQQSPMNPASWVFLARAEFTVENFDGALLALDRASAVAAGNPQALQQIAAMGNNMRAAIQQQKAAAEKEAGQAPAPAPGGGK